MDPSRPTPLVSIVLPTFGRLHYLRPTVDCIRRQSFEDWELLVADDGSDAETREYLRALATESRVRVIWLAHTGVPARVRNAALREARGQYVAFLDSDDLWEPQKLARQIQTLQERPGCQWSYTGFVQIDGSGQILLDAPHGRWVPCDGWIFESLVAGPFLPIRTPCVLASRELIARCGGFDEAIRSGEDYDLWLRLALESQVAVVDEPLVQVRRHEENHSQDWEAAYAGRDYSLAKLGRRVDNERWRALLRLERTTNALNRAAIHASRDNSAPMMRTLWRSLPYSWMSPRWWFGLVKIPLRPYVPRALVDAYRKHRYSAGAP
jgi:glycosyltransferase involved in cell wall biosynthesis